jgi:hypothetical protein
VVAATGSSSSGAASAVAAVSTSSSSGAASAVVSVAGAASAVVAVAVSSSSGAASAVVDVAGSALSGAASAVVAVAGSAAPPPPPPPPVERRARLPRQDELWHGFVVSRVVSGTTGPIGWGIVCKRHSGDCKKQITHGVEELSDSVCKRSLKKWIIMGYDIDPDEPGAQKRHVRCANLRVLDVPLTADLDAELDAAKVAAIAAGFRA